MQYLSARVYIFLHMPAKSIIRVGMSGNNAGRVKCVKYSENKKNSNN